MRRPFLSREARRRFRHYRNEIIHQIVTERNPRTGNLRVHEAGKSMMYVATSPITYRVANAQARELVLVDIDWAKQNKVRLREMPEWAWAQELPHD